MVRRWSHINFINFDFSNFTKFEKRHKIKNFKSLVHFKRFTFKITKFRRKSMARFKHTSNWLIYTNAIKFWTFDYHFHRNYSKIQYLNKIFLNNALVYNFNYIKLRNESFSYNFNFFFSIWTKKSYWYFNKNVFNYFKNNNITFIWYTDQPLLGNSVIQSYHEWDSTLYTPSMSKINSTVDQFSLSSIFDSNLQIFLNQIVEIRKILTLLFFFKLNFNNVK